MDSNPKQDIVEKIKDASNVLVTVSANPSVDDLAACIGLTLMLSKLDKHSTAVFSGNIPEEIDFLNPKDTLESDTASLRDFIISLDKEKADKLRYKVEDDVVRIFITPYRTKITKDDFHFEEGDFNVDLVIALGVTDQDHLDSAIKAHGRILHDATVATVNSGDKGSTLGTIDWHDSEASSLSEMLVSVSEALEGGILDQQISTALLSGIVWATDRFSNKKTTPKIMTMAAQLMAAGANQQLIAQNLGKDDGHKEVLRMIKDGDLKTDPKKVKNEIDLRKDHKKESPKHDSGQDKSDKDDEDEDDKPAKKDKPDNGNGDEGSSGGRNISFGPLEDKPKPSPSGPVPDLDLPPSMPPADLASDFDEPSNLSPIPPLPSASSDPLSDLPSVPLPPAPQPQARQSQSPKLPAPPPIPTPANQSSADNNLAPLPPLPPQPVASHSSPPLPPLPTGSPTGINQSLPPLPPKPPQPSPSTPPTSLPPLPPSPSPVPDPDPAPKRRDPLLVQPNPQPEPSRQGPLPEPSHHRQAPITQTPVLAEPPASKQLSSNELAQKFTQNAQGSVGRPSFGGRLNAIGDDHLNDQAQTLERAKGDVKPAEAHADAAFTPTKADDVVPLDVDAARREVTDAVNSVPFDPANNPLESINAAPLNVDNNVNLDHPEPVPVPAPTNTAPPPPSQPVAPAPAADSFNLPPPQ